MNNSKIEWTEFTWNPVTGCTKVSPGCKHCYAETMAHRLKAMGVPAYARGFEVVKQPNRIFDPWRRPTPTMYFVNSMSDLFHPDIDFEYIEKVFYTMFKAPWHTFQVLTKRAERMREYMHTQTALDNVWLGVSVENKKHGLPRIPVLREIEAKVRFLSIEPLLEDLGAIDLEGIDWVIVGGESGHKARPMDKRWVISIREQCKAQKVPFFFKQWGRWGEDGQSRNKKANGRTLNGRVWNGIPIVAQHG